MVHALEEVWRVVKPGGPLIELRPAPVHRQLWVLTRKRRIFIGRMHEDLAPDHAADAALRRFTQNARPAVRARRRATCHRYLDSLREFRGFLEEFEEAKKSTATHKRLLERVERAWTLAEGRKRIMVTGPLQMTVLGKLA